MHINIPDETQVGPFKREIATLRRNLSEILKHPGEWVLIYGDAVEGYFLSQSEASAAGYQRFGLEAKLLVKEINSLTAQPQRFRIPTGCSVWEGGKD